VTTSAGAEGLRLEAVTKDDPQPCLVADRAEDFIFAIKRLYADGQIWSSVSRAGVEHVRKEFTLESQARDLETALQNILLGRTT